MHQAGFPYLHSVPGAAVPEKPDGEAETTRLDSLPTPGARRLRLGFRGQRGRASAPGLVLGCGARSPRWFRAGRRVAPTSTSVPRRLLPVCLLLFCSQKDTGRIG